MVENLFTPPMYTNEDVTSFINASQKYFFFLKETNKADILN